MAKKYPKGVAPPCPGQPADFNLVDRNGYYYWRRKRGTIKPATLNAALQLRRQAMIALSPAIKQLKLVLLPLMPPLPTGRMHNDLFKWLQQDWIDYGHVRFNNMLHKELHEKYTLQRIFHAAYRSMWGEGYVHLSIPACQYAVKRHNTLVTEFMLEAVLVWEGAKGFETKTQTSSLYTIDEGMHVGCNFSWQLPEQGPWLLLLKLICFEGKKLANHPMHYGIKVLETGYQ